MQTQNYINGVMEQLDDRGSHRVGCNLANLEEDLSTDTCYIEALVSEQFEPQGCTR